MMILCSVRALSHLQSSPSHMTSSWHGFLQSSAISYASSSTSSSSTSIDEEAANASSANERYWHPTLLDEWRCMYYPSSTNDDDINNSIENLNFSSSGSDINYGSYILLPTFLAEILCKQLSLGVYATALPSSETMTTACDDNDDNDVVGGEVRKVGISIPEGPFLPLFILAIHSLNVAISENWIAVCIDDSDDDEECENNYEPNNSKTRQMTRRRKCNGVAMVPLELDDAPDRLCHMLADAKPDFILVDNISALLYQQQTRKNKSIQQQQQQQYTFVDYVTLVKEAITLYHKHMQKYNNDNNNDAVSSLMEELWPIEIRNNALDSIRYPNLAVAESFDVPRLVAIGLVRRLASSACPAVFTTTMSSSMTNNHQHRSADRHIVSHIVYTSGTTGKAKGCVSSLASLHHYIRAKNLAHEINTTSKVLLASAVTFDPCLSDITATCVANATLCLTSREQLYGHGLGGILHQLGITHVLCTPSLWSNVELFVDNNNISSYYNDLQIVALGGEPIPKAMIQRWARSQKTDGTLSRAYPRLCATYGVTEACVYQTFGEVVVHECSNDDEKMKDEEEVSSFMVNLPGKNVGQSLIGANISICRPYSQEDDDDEGAEHSCQQSSGPKIGEVVLSGAQVDALSSYLNSIELASRVFVQCIDDDYGSLGVNDTYFYRTGDLGCIDPKTRNLHILGRIKGDGMVKFNGIRIELSEIENACIDDANYEEDRLVIDCMATLSVSSSRSSDDDSVHQNNQLVAYCLFSSVSLLELGVRSQDLKSGIIVTPGPLLALLRMRCDRRVRKGCTPSVFVIIDRLPLSPTGKRCRSSLPPLSTCSIMNSSTSDNENKRNLRECGKVGSIVSNKICECLNLQSCQRQLVTLDANFFVLGGDSLAASRVVRGLHAIHHGIMDNRNLGGGTGTLDGPFATKHLLQSETLGAYHSFLVSKGAFCTSDDPVPSILNSDRHPSGPKMKEEEIVDPLYDSLLESITLGHTRVACSLLYLGVDPNVQVSGSLGKISDRMQQRILFKSNPLHLACARGDPHLVRKLLCAGCKANTPDASGSYPIHLACSRIENKFDDAKEDLRRLECAKLLLEMGKTPISIRDGNKQTILHCTARSGHCKLLDFLMNQWKIAVVKFDVRTTNFDWRDRWYRTPVHWAVLNQRIASLQILLDGGCSAFPPQPKVNKRTSAKIESPLEMCERLYCEDHVIRDKIRALLVNAEY